MPGTGINLDDDDMVPDPDYVSKGTLSEFNLTPFINSALHFAARSLRMSKVWALRVGKACGSIPSLNYDIVHTIYWYTGSNHTFHIESSRADGTGKTGAVQWRDVDAEGWERIRFIQVLSGSSELYLEDGKAVDPSAVQDPSGSKGEPEIPDREPEVLETISEHTEPSNDTFCIDCAKTIADNPEFFDADMIEALYSLKGMDAYCTQMDGCS